MSPSSVFESCPPHQLAYYLERTYARPHPPPEERSSKSTLSSTVWTIVSAVRPLILSLRSNVFSMNETLRPLSPLSTMELMGPYSGLLFFPPRPSMPCHEPPRWRTFPCRSQGLVEKVVLGDELLTPSLVPISGHVPVPDPDAASSDGCLRESLTS